MKLLQLLPWCLLSPIHVRAFMPVSKSFSFSSNTIQLRKKSSLSSIILPLNRQHPVCLLSSLSKDGEKELTKEKISVILEVTFIEACLQLATG